MIRRALLTPLLAAGVLLAAAFGANDVSAGWGGGSCGPVGLPSFQPLAPTACAPVAPAYSWAATDDPDELGLLLGGRQVGAWRRDRGVYRALSPDGSWGPKADAPPVPPPPDFVARVRAKKKADETCRCAAPCSCEGACGCAEGGPAKCRPGSGCTCAAAKPKHDCGCGHERECDPRVCPADCKCCPNFGVDLLQIHAGEDSIAGRPVSRRELIEAIGAGDAAVPDDAGLLFVTVAGGPESARKAILDALNGPALAAQRPQLRVQDYAAGEWPLAAGFRATAEKPEVYWQLPTGAVVMHLTAPTADEVARATRSAIRRKADGYDPAKDPDLTAPAPPPAPAPKPDAAPAPAPAKADELEANMPACCVVGGALALLALAGRRKASS